MRLLGHELRKLFTGAALWIFVVLCVAFNMWTMPTWLNRDFDTTTPFHENVFENFNTSILADMYSSGLTGSISERMRAKFYALQPVVDEKALAGYSYSPYFGEYTFLMHQNLFGTFGVMGRLLLQGMLLATLLALLGMGYEKINNTEHGVYATRTGRKILRYKIVASLVAGIGIYVLLATVTLATYFTIFDFSGVWSSSVSSGFNFDGGGMPFTTWHSFTVASYLWASLGVSLGLVLCFSLMGAAVGTLSKNGYIGFLIVVLINAVCLLLIMFPTSSYIHYAAFLTPIRLWLSNNYDVNNLWFTDGGHNILWRNFELWGTGISLLLLTVLCILAVKFFEKRNIA